MTVKILVGDCRHTMASIPDASVHCCVTSPPYFGLRSYLPNDHPDKPLEVGAEDDPYQYVENMVAVFRQVWRCLRDDGTVWLNLGDSYASAGGHSAQGRTSARIGRTNIAQANAVRGFRPGIRVDGIKAKDLIGIPWMVAFALRADGWYLRAENIWAKRNCMPESVQDRPTRAHEQVFLLTKHPTYFFDAHAVEEDGETPAGTRGAKGSAARAAAAGVNGRPPKYHEYSGRRNKRSVWWETTFPFPEAHFATMTPPVAETCILAGSSEHGTCGTCGAPFVRSLGPREPTGGRGSGNVERLIPTYGEQGRTNTTRGIAVPYAPAVRATVGWEPTCACSNRQPTRPALVLDPFGGAGTTALVADRHKRDAILCEISEEFAEMTARRIRKEAGMLTGITVLRTKPSDFHSDRSATATTNVRGEIANG